MRFKPKLFATIRNSGQQYSTKYYIYETLQKKRSWLMPWRKLVKCKMIKTQRLFSEDHGLEFTSWINYKHLCNVLKNRHAH